MDVCFLLTLYIQYITNFYYCQKWKVEGVEKSGRRGIAGDWGEEEPKYTVREVAAKLDKSLEDTLIAAV